MNPDPSSEDTQTASGLDATIRVDVRATLPPGLEQPGDMIGRYKLLEPLGEGGFGSVWRAEQFEPIHREVALKVIKAGMDSREIIARFAAERQALAMMDHPNIAAVLDAGTTESGRPFFAMELVKGVPLTEFCDARRLTIRQRLELFIPVCQAVQHAHQKAILHRDLKPSNILVVEVDSKAAPKVIDFGIAKALGGAEEQAFQASLARTQAGMIIGTPQYMSPEQAGAEPDLDTRSDIYTLGVILYELLVGDTPLGHEQMRKAAKDEIMRLVREADAKRPSSRLLPVTAAAETAAQHRQSDTKRLSHTLRGDLDWIVLKALEKDRSRRYETANALARDIVHHLNSEPVEAGPPSTAYRVRKFVRRNQLAVGAAAAMLFLLIAGVAVSTWQAVRANAAEDLALSRLEQVTLEKQRADEETAISKAVNDFLQNDLLRQAGSRAQADAKQEADPNLTVRQALERAADRVGDRFKDQPQVEAAIRRTIGNACLDTGDHVRAIGQLEAALALYKAKLGPEHPDTLTSMGSLAVAYLDAGKLDQALSLSEETLKLKKARLGPEHPATLTSMGSLADAYLAVGKLDQALTLFEETLRLMKAKLGAEHPQTLIAMRTLAAAYRAGGRPKEALSLYEETFKLTKAKLDSVHPNTLASMNDLAVAYRDALKMDQALPLLEETVRLMKAKLGPEHPNTLTSMNNLAGAYQTAGKLDQALSLYEETLALRKDKLNPEHRATLTLMSNLAGAYQDAGKMDQALPLLEETFRLMKAKLGPEHPDTLSLMNNLAAVYRAVGKREQALRLFEETLALRQTKLGPEHPDTLITMGHLAVSYQAAGRLDQALPLYEETLKLHKAKLGPEHPGTLATMNGLALAYKAAGRLDQALPLYEETLRLRQAKLGPEHTDTLRSMSNLAGAYQTAGKLEQTLPLYEETLKLHKAKLGPEHPDTLATMNGLALAYKAAGKLEQALPLYEETLKLHKAKLGPEHPGTLITSIGLGAVYAKAKRYSDAEPLLIEAHAGLSLQKDNLSITPRKWLRISMLELVALYTTTGKPEQAAEWKQKLADFDQAEASRKPAAAPKTN